VDSKCPSDFDGVLPAAVRHFGRRTLHLGHALAATERPIGERSFETKWITVFRTLQNEIDRLAELGVPSFVYFLAKWRKLAPYYASLSGFTAAYTVVPTRYILKRYRLISDGHANPEGNQLIAGYIYNALRDQKLISGLEPLSISEPLVFPGRIFKQQDVDDEFTNRPVSGSDLIPLKDDFVGREGLFSVEAAANAGRVRVDLMLIDDPGLYPLTIRIELECPEHVGIEKVICHFTSEPQAIEVSKPASLDKYSFIEVRVTADHVVANGSLPVSMKRPRVRVIR